MNKRLGSSARPVMPCLAPAYGWITTIATFFCCRVISSYPCAAYEIAVVDVQSTQTELLQQSWWCEKSAKATAACRFNMFSMFNQMVVWQDLRPTLRPPWSNQLKQSYFSRAGGVKKVRKPQRSADLTYIYICIRIYIRIYIYTLMHLCINT